MKAISQLFEPAAQEFAYDPTLMNISQASQAISLKRIADALEKQNDLTAQLWLHQGKQET